METKASDVYRIAICDDEPLLAQRNEALTREILTEDGLVEALEHVRLPLWGVQFHPERQAFGRRRAGAADGAGIFERFRILCAAQSPA